MARATDRNSFQRNAERRSPHRVVIPVPGNGLGRRLTTMLDWRHANVAAGEWAEHGHQVRKKGEPPLDFARWYSMSDADAEAFKNRWVKT